MMAFTSDQWLVFLLPILLLGLAGAAWVVVRRTIRTRIRLGQQLRDDPDITEWLVIFDWSRKVLYLPTVIFSLVAAVLMRFYPPENPAHNAVGSVVGGIWLGVFFLNFLIDEYEVNVKAILIAVLLALALVLWLAYLNWLVDFFKWFAHLDVRMNSTGYMIIAIIFLMAVLISWLRGLFYYVAITPNYVSIQAGPTESGEQISREDYNTRVDTGDFLERVLGFGKIIVTFRDSRRQPLILLVGGIGKKAKMLESIRGALAIERGSKAEMDSSVS
jgi:hypothetical protein